jgi:hypothetical protein
MRVQRIPERVGDLRHTEPVEVDADRLEGFCRKRGEDAEVQVADLLAELDHAVSLCRWEYTEGDPTGVARAAAIIHELASELGMVTLERAAIHVLDCLHREDTVSLSACAARLFRVSDSLERSEWILGSPKSGEDNSA